MHTPQLCQRDDRVFPSTFEARGVQTSLKGQQFMVKILAGSLPCIPQSSQFVHIPEGKDGTLRLFVAVYGILDFS